MALSLAQPFVRPRLVAQSPDASRSRPCGVSGRDVCNESSAWVPRGSRLAARSSAASVGAALRQVRRRRGHELGLGIRVLALADPQTGPSPAQGEDEPERQAEATGQLWSSLILEEGKLVHSPGNLIAATALISGSTVGAGVLALPAATATSGFVASSVTLTFGWGFSVLTGLLIAEVSYALLRQGLGGVSILGMARQTLGTNGSYFCTAVYLFQSYALLVAYISRGGEIINSRFLGPEIFGAGQATFAIGIALLLYSASPKQLDTFNSAAVLTVVVSLLALVYIVSPGIDPDRLLIANWGQVVESVPVILLAFVYQNMVPVIVTQLEGDMRKVTTAIVAGTAVPWAMFMAWDAAVLGQRSPGDLDFEKVALDPVAMVQAAGGAGGVLLDFFSIFAVGTSFVGFVIALSDFLVEMGGEVPTGRPSPTAYAGVVLPPLAVALTYPDLFFPALEAAGLFGVLVLWGIVPAAMALNTRATIGGDARGIGELGAGRKEPPLPEAARAPGGDALAWAVIAFSSVVIVYDVATNYAGGGV